MRIQHNIMAMSAYRNYTNNVSAMKKNLEKLSSGYKINRAGDDAAGLAISEKMRAQITGLETAQKNAKDGISLVQTAEGALTEVHDMLNRMVELATQSANGTYDDGQDRYQLQKEVDQLRAEINRIADSSNFNGINLLDGSLGLNTDAFTKIEGVSAQVSSDGAIDGSALVQSANMHLETTGVTQSVAPGLAIDLGTLAVAKDVTGNLEFDIMGQTVTVALTAGDTTAALTAGDIASKLVNQLKQIGTTTGTFFSIKAADGSYTSTTADATGLRIGDFAFTIGTNDSAVTLTYAGYYTGAAANTFVTAGGGNNDTEEFTTTMEGNINTLLGKGVSLKDTSTAATTGDVVHNTTKVIYAQAKTPSELAGADIKLNADVVQQGGKLTIDGQTYVFKTDATATLTTAAGEITIDVTAGKTDAERIHMAVDKLSQQAEITGKTDGTANGRKWKISSAGADTIHIDQTNATTPGKDTMKDADAIKAIVSGVGKPTAAANVGTKITIDDSKVKEGNTLTITNGDTTTKYVFNDDKAGTTGADGTVYVGITGGATANLAAALNVTGDDLTSTTITLRGVANAAGEVSAPTILGKGLTLQIGDTSDSFNQLNVAVKDCHTSSLFSNGDGKLNISTEEAAQAAIQTIKDAINYVSDVRGTLGATQNRLDHTINNLSVMTENIQDAESTIRDVDVAEEMMAYTKNNILIQSAQAMLAQANQVPQGVLQLLQ